MSPTRTISKMYQIGGYLAIWPACYAIAVYLLTSWLLLESTPQSDSILFILLCAHGCYLLDRVKITDQRQDPADALALPDRSMLFARYAKSIRALITFELVVCSMLGWSIHPLLTLIPISALEVVHIYAGRGATPKSPRLKDLPALKAFLIASGFLSLTISVLWATQHDLLIQLRWLDGLALLGLWLIIVADAILCDIDDHDADLAYSTMSLAVLLGSRSAWKIAFVSITLGSLLIVNDQRSMVGVGALLILTTLSTRKNTNHRDFVDARLLPIVLFSIWLTNL